MASSTPYWLLRRADQTTVAVLVLIGFVAVVGWWMVQKGTNRRMIEVEQVEPVSVKYQVDVNRADWPELIELPGVGEKLARRIIESREKEGPFTKREDLLRVDGIGAKTLENLRPFLLPLTGKSEPSSRTK